MYCSDMYLAYLLFHWQSTHDKNWTIWCGYVWRENSCLYIFTCTIIWIMSHFLTADNGPVFQWNVGKYGGKSHIYHLHLHIWIICCCIDSNEGGAQSRVSSKIQLYFSLLFSNSYVSNLFILDRNTKAIISQDWCDVIGLYFAPSNMWILSTYFEDRRILEPVGINSSQDYLDWVESQMDSNNIYYFKLQTWNLDLHPA